MEPELLKLITSGSATPVALWGIYLLSKIAGRLASIERKVNSLVIAIGHTLPAEERALFLERNLMRSQETDTIFKKAV